MNASDSQFWMMITSIVTAACFIIMAIALAAIAIIVKKVIGMVNRLEKRIEPLLSQINQLSLQGRKIAGQFNELSGHLVTASKNVSESTGLIKEEVAELKQLVGQTAMVAKNKVEIVSEAIDRTQLKVTTTADFIQAKVIQPASEIAAIMVGVRKGLEVLFAPSPKRIDRAYQEDEMFIG